MKTLKQIVFVIAILTSFSLKAQVSVNVNIGSPPQWGPAGYDGERYYYLPDVECYYDVQQSTFIYYERNVWVRRTYLPNRYRNYDLYNGYKVVINNYRGDSPYTNFKDHKMKYAKGYRGGPQKTIGNRQNAGSNKKSYSGNHSPQQTKGNNAPNKGGGNPHGNGGGKGNGKGH